MSSEPLNMRVPPELIEIIDAARGQSPNRSAAARALMYLGAHRLEMDITPAQRELVLLLLEGLDPRITDELRTILGGLPKTVAPRVRHSRSAPGRRGSGAGSQPANTEAHAAPPAPASAPAAHRSVAVPSSGDDVFDVGAEC